jgi:cell division GTPase FtsZ
MKMETVSTYPQKSQISELVQRPPVDGKNRDDAETCPIPTLELEQYEPAFPQRPEKPLQTEGSIRYGWIGTGRCGCRIVKALYQFGHTKVIAADTNSDDLAELKLPEHLKFLMTTGTESETSTTDMRLGKNAIDESQQQFLHLAKKIFNTGIDHIMLCLGAGGGTSSGSIIGLIEIAKRYARYIGLDRPNKNVGVVMALPARNIGANPNTISNAYKVAKKLFQMASAGKISPLIIIDNNCINRMYLKSYQGSLWSSVNYSFASLFDTFNKLSSKSSPYTSFDPIEYRSIIQAGGCCVMGLSQIRNLDDPFAISEAVKRNCHQSIFASGFDMTTTKQAGCIVVGGKKLIADVKGLQNNIDYAFDVLSELTGSATTHRGIYEDNSKSLKVYTILGGLEPPQGQLQKLNSKEYYQPSLAELKGLTLHERKEDIISLAEYFLSNHSLKFKEPQKSLSPDAKIMLLNYPWPGDIPQLAAAMERAYILTTGEQIECSAFPADIIFADYKSKQIADWKQLDTIRCEVIGRALDLTADKNSAAQILGISTELVEWYVENMKITPKQKKSSNKKRVLIPS